jgi:uncharacterized protein (DUF983 family)
LHQYIKIRRPCEACGTDNTVYPSDDFPPYLTILVVGHVVVPLFIWSDRYEPPLLPARFCQWMTDLMAAGYVLSYFIWLSLLFLA